MPGSAPTMPMPGSDGPTWHQDRHDLAPGIILFNSGLSFAGAEERGWGGDSNISKVKRGPEPREQTPRSCPLLGVVQDAQGRGEEGRGTPKALGPQTRW